METVIDVLKELVDTNRQILEQNKQIVEKLDAIQSDLRIQREITDSRKQFKAKAFKDIDIQYIMKHKNVGPDEAAQRLLEHRYDIAKATRAWGGDNELKLERVLIHYAKKHNQAVIEMW